MFAHKAIQGVYGLAQDQRTVEAAAAWEARSSLRAKTSEQRRAEAVQQELQTAAVHAERVAAAARAAAEQAERQERLKAACPSNTERRAALAQRARELAASREEQRQQVLRFARLVKSRHQAALPTIRSL